MRIVLAILIFLQMSFALGKTVDIYTFLNPAQEQRFHKLVSELRCLVCQNQSLAESNAPLARDLKAQVYQQVVSGYSDEEIKRYLVLRYGDYILFKPTLSKVTFILWLGPMIFLCGAFAILFFSMRRQNLSVNI